MKRLLFAIALSVSLPALANDVIPELKVTKAYGGDAIYKNAKVSKVEPDGIRFIHDGGFVKVPYEKLSEELSNQYKFDAEKAKAFRAEKEATRLVALENSDATQSPTKQEAPSDSEKSANPSEGATKKNLHGRFTIGQFVDGGASGTLVTESKTVEAYLYPLEAKVGLSVGTTVGVQLEKNVTSWRRHTKNSKIDQISRSYPKYKVVAVTR